MGDRRWKMGASDAAGMSLWEYTLTAGFNVIDNLLIRAEYRMDWGTNSTQNSAPKRTGERFWRGTVVLRRGGDCL